MANVTLVKVSHNIYGNYRGYVTGEGWKELGCNEYDAIAWTSEALLRVPNPHLSIDSYVTYRQIIDYRDNTS